MIELRRKVLLPAFQLSEIVPEGDPRAIKRVIESSGESSPFTYHYRWALRDSRQGFNYNLFPVVLDKASVPWPLGTLYILSHLEGDTRPIMRTYHSRADDLGAYKEWLDTHENSDELVFQFPKMKLRRPTYRYRGHLQDLVFASELRPNTAKRRMATVVAFYRWLIDNKYFTPDHPPWEEKQYNISYKSRTGALLHKTVQSTDIRISAPKSEDPFDGTIQDGGKLRPLTGKEQNWILETTAEKGNTECYLMQLSMLACGARIQTAGTFRLRNFTELNQRFSAALSGKGEVFKLKAGPGTNIDTKNNKTGVLHIPRPLYELLQTYGASPRARGRRERFLKKYGHHHDPYLFLTQQGSPYYAGRADTTPFNPTLDRRHEKTGQSIRQFLHDHIIPTVQERHEKSFSYRLHDLRASFGMNMTELLMELVQQKVITLARARLTVKELMWHESFATTDLYLNYRTQMSEIYSAVNGYGEQLQRWISIAMHNADMRRD